jgi:hypothetical protein
MFKIVPKITCRQPWIRVYYMSIYLKAKLEIKVTLTAKKSKLESCSCCIYLMYHHIKIFNNIFLLWLIFPAASQSFQVDQALVVCVLSEICCRKNTTQQFELCFKTNQGEIMTIESITHKFIGTKCRALVGRPKIFLFLDTSQRTDPPNIPIITV